MIDFTCIQQTAEQQMRYHAKQMKPGRPYSVSMKEIRPKRTTGPRSQNSRFHGHCTDVSEQTGYTPEEIKAAMKRMAVDDGYKTYLAPDGTEQPRPTRYCDVEEMALLQQVLQRYADIHNLWLTEYDDDEIPYKSLGGRLKKEMEGLDKEINKD